jgi:ABC-type nitrate/sulfonate/bicarbonate transport system permease component
VGGAAVLARSIAPGLDAAFDFARSIPPVVLLPVFLLAFGWNDQARVATIASACLRIMALPSRRAPRSIRRDVLDLAGASRARALLWTEPWESLGPLAVGLRTSASMAILVAVVTEMVAGADRGIGTRVIAGQIAGDTTAFTHAVLAIGVVGWVINIALRKLEARVRAY